MPWTLRNKMLNYKSADRVAPEKAVILTALLHLLLLGAIIGDSAMATEIQIQLSNTEAAYLAGIIDGEGSICVFPYYGYNHKVGKKYARYKPVICVSNTDCRLINWLKEHLSGQCYSVERKTKKWKIQYMWQISHLQALEIIKVVKPYLILKTEQANLFIKFMETAKRWGRCGCPSTIQNKRKEIVEQICKLNRKGRNALDRK